MYFSICLNILVPKYLIDYLTRNDVHSYNTRRRTDLQLPKPKLSHAKRTDLYQLLHACLYSILFKSLLVFLNFILHF